LLELVREEYKDLIFNAVISRRAAIGRLPVYGIIKNPEIKAATEQHRDFIEELLIRVN
jgi:chromosome partitioning protein